MLFKKSDEWARPIAEYDVIARCPTASSRSRSGWSRSASRAPPRRRASRSALDARRARSAAAARRALPASSRRSSRRSSPLPPGGEWIFEIKFDGYRFMARVDGGKAQAVHARRPRLDRRRWWPGRRRSRSSASTGWLDGEIVVMGETACPTSTRCRTPSTRRARRRSTTSCSTCRSSTAGTCEVPLRVAPALLQRCSRPRRRARSASARAFDGDPAQILEAACADASKASWRSAPTRHTSAAHRDLAQGEVPQRQEFVVGGFTDRTTPPPRSAACCSAIRRAGKLRSAGSVGTGWDARDRSRRCTAAREARGGPRRFDAATIAARPMVPAHRRQRAMGEADAGRRGRVSRVDAGRQRAPRRLPGPARGQAGGVGEREVARAAADRRPGGTASRAPRSVKVSQPRPRHRRRPPA